MLNFSNDIYINKYNKYKKKYTRLKNQNGGLKLPQDSDYPLQDVYENSIEPIWKNILGNKLNDFIDEYYKVLSESDISNLNTFIDQFNSLYEINPVYTNFDSCIKKISDISQNKLTEIRNTCFKETNNLISYINSLGNDVVKTPLTILDVGRVSNKIVFITDKKSELFSLEKIYLKGILKLLVNNNTDDISLDNINSNYIKGFNLSEDENQIISTNIYNSTNLNTTMLEILLNLEKKSMYNTNLNKLQINKNDNTGQIKFKINEAVLQSFFYIGKLFGVIANYLYYHKNKKFNSVPNDIDDPIKNFLIVAGVINYDDFGSSVAKGFQRIALSHSAHGMSSAELVARLASSVRTSYPLALISGLCVRSGIYHGGAMQEAIPMIKEFIKNSKKILIVNNDLNSIDFNNFVGNYVDSLFSKGKLFGFGHRIHKNPKIGEPCADPRALEYLEIINNIFKDKYQLELLLINKFLETIRIKKTTLGCNSDFAIALLCVLLNVDENDAGGLFVMCRIPGFCARIVRELFAKANARRLPFPVILPYILPKK